MSGDPFDEKSLMIFGRDASKIPCFRNSFLYGISGGVVAGLGVFLFTSRPKLATDLAMASFFVITTSYWVQCRYNYSKTKFEMQRVQELLRQHSLLEGSEKERQLDAKIKSKSVDI